MKEYSIEKSDRTKMNPKLPTVSNKLIVGISTLAALLAMAACDGKKEAPSMQNQQGINNYEDEINSARELYENDQLIAEEIKDQEAQDYDAIKEVLTEEADNFWDTSARFKPLVKLLRKNPWIFAKIKRDLKRTDEEVERLKADPILGSSFKVVLNSKYNVEITADPYNFLRKNGGFFLMLVIEDKKGNRILQLTINDDTDTQDLSIIDWTKRTYSDRCDRYTIEGPFEVEFEIDGKNSKNPSGNVGMAEFELQKKIDKLKEADFDLKHERSNNLAEHMPPEVVQILRMLSMDQIFM
ncbi:hypothetical protein ACFL10_01835 [Patescibacteria group bacterium]